ncbi:hypothetical protein SLEP1_g27955 [Rubroshorea leprosula]|uniref:Uncharacterized protein n=1 Tax=Rubroshorea leprosula TaxID=152421 RepID=A0AAV5K3H7_9ROSI|nr:hypothetical protein SLEP1_g27955 [Rubroshorea leprosula]
MLESACAPFFDDPSGFDGLLSPPADLRWRARELPDLTPTAGLYWVDRRVSRMDRSIEGHGISEVVRGCSSAKCTSLQPLDMGLL